MYWKVLYKYWPPERCGWERTTGPCCSGNRRGEHLKQEICYVISELLFVQPHYVDLEANSFVFPRFQKIYVFTKDIKMCRLAKWNPKKIQPTRHTVEAYNKCYFKAFCWIAPMLAILYIESLWVVIKKHNRPWYIAIWLNINIQHRDTYIFWLLRTHIHLVFFCASHAPIVEGRAFLTCEVESPIKGFCSGWSVW